MMFKVFNCHNYHELKNKFQVSKIGLLAQWVKFQKIFKDKTYFCDFFGGGGGRVWTPLTRFPLKLCKIVLNHWIDYFFNVWRC